MKKLSAVVFLSTSFGFSSPPQLPVALGTATTYSVLAHSTVTNTGLSIVNGDVGLSPGTSVTGFPPGVVVNGAIHAADGAAATAINDATVAYNQVLNRTGATPIIGDLGGQTLLPGLYKASSSQGISGILTLDGQGNPSSVFIFQIGSTLTTSSGSQVLLINGASAANVFWQIGSSATLGTGSTFSGTILALSSATSTTSTGLVGRLLALTGSVTLDTITANNPGAPIVGGPTGPLTVSCPASGAQLNVPYNSIVSATGGTPPYTFSTTGTLPPGLALIAASGVVHGTPTAVGSTSFSANASDAALGSATSACSITVAAGPAPPTTPAPASLVLVLIGFTLMLVYVYRESILRALRS